MDTYVRLLEINIDEFREIENQLTGGSGRTLGGDAGTLLQLLRNSWRITAMTSLEQHIFVSVSR